MDPLHIVYRLFGFTCLFVQIVCSRTTRVNCTMCVVPRLSLNKKYASIEFIGDLPVEDVPQIVILTFDDSVNDLNKQLYSDLFNKGRVNPNGCPISATFYVSHEWTDYSQVQNLYSEGHEMASHTVS